MSVSIDGKIFNTGDKEEHRVERLELRTDFPYSISGRQMVSPPSEW
jgi:hypothetical protein